MKQLICFVLTLVLLLGLCAMPTSAAESVVYVSATGLDTNAGTENAPIATLTKAYTKNPDKIILLDNTTYSMPSAHTKTVTISGKTADVQLYFKDGSSFAGPTVLDNMTITGSTTQIALHCNGHPFTVTDSVTCLDTRIALFGGKQSGTYTGDTHLNIYGGSYNYIYGGNRGDGTFTGNTYVTVGGNVNKGEGIDDAASNISPCMIYGGGQGPLIGSTYVTLEGNAVTKYVVGAGNDANATVSDSTNIYINGGKVMNVYGGAKTAPLTCNTNITMTGGIAEALFGGSETNSMTGNTHITVLGGEVYRRIYSGCYNDWTLSYKSSYYVTGNTYLVLGKDASIINKNALSSDNRDNMGIFSGSRLGAQKNEINTLIYLDGASAKHKSNVGDVSGWSWAFKNCADYTVTATGDGSVKGSDTQNNTIELLPADGYASFISNTPKTSFTLSASSTAVDFKKTFKIENVTATATDNKPSVTVNFWAENALNETNPRLFVAIYDDNGKMVSSDVISLETTLTTHTFDLDCTLETNKNYSVKAFMWKNQSSPILETQTTTLIN